MVELNQSRAAVVKVMYYSPIPEPAAHDQTFAAMAARHKLPGTEVHVTSSPPGEGQFRHIEFRSYEAMVARGIVRAVRQAEREGFDAFAIGCFYDPALHDAREVSSDMVVTAPCVAACEIVASLANRFGIIVGRRKWVHQMATGVREYGHAHRLAGFYPVDLGVTEFQRDQAETGRRLIAVGRKAVEEDFAEALILGCTMEVGFYQDVQSQLGVPVIDPSMAAFKRAEYGAVLKRQCGWRPSRRWSCEPPPESEIAAIGSFDDGDAFGHRIVVPAA